MSTRRWAIALLVVAGMATACASLANTEAQRLAEERWRVCARQLPFVHIRSIDLDGRIRFSHVAPSDRDEMFRCLDAANQSGPRLPEPVAIGEPRP
jgi:hypothetical protein